MKLETKKATDRNGYAPSLFKTEPGVCYITGLHTDTARHEIFGGANRENSKADGLWINVSPRVHDDIHANKGEYEYLSERAETLWLAEDWSRSIQDFYNRYQKNYIGGDNYAK